MKRKYNTIILLISLILIGLFLGEINKFTGKILEPSLIDIIAGIKIDNGIIYYSAIKNPLTYLTMITFLKEDGSNRLSRKINQTSGSYKSYFNDWYTVFLQQSIPGKGYVRISEILTNPAMLEEATTSEEEPVVTISAKCTDSDGGRDYSNKGALTITHSNGAKTGYTDICAKDSGNPTADKKALIEYNCEIYQSTLTTTQRAYEFYSCPNGCENGACLPSAEGTIVAPTPITLCTDTDGGKNYYVKGKGEGLYSASKIKGLVFGEELNEASSRMDYSLSYSIYYDHCFNSTTSNQLNEAYCENGVLESAGFVCQYGCKDGACLSAAPACTNECSSRGIKTCINWTSYKVCGNFDADNCLEWTANIICPSGQTCSNGTCISQTSQCIDTCSSLGHECGTYAVCGVETNCGVCPSGFECVKNITISKCKEMLNVSEKSECSAQYLDLCQTQEKCITHNLYWWDNACHTEQQTVKPESCPSDTVCTSFWPTYEGTFLSGIGSACNTFEVCNPDLDKFVEKAKIGCNWTTTSIKKCVGYSIVRALGKEASIMQGYFTPEICCNGNVNDPVDKSHCKDFSYFGKCDSQEDPISNFNSFAKQLQCSSSSLSNKWVSDTDMSKNTCNFITHPAHVSLNILKTGTCQDYSVALTTLLRKAGYSPSEVMSVSGFRHAYNLVKFPGDEKYHFVDTTGNGKGLVENVIRPRDIPLGKSRFPIYKQTKTKGIDMTVQGHVYYDYCSLAMESCYNDNGYVQCPDKSQIYGCDVAHIYYMTSCNWNWEGVIHGNCGGGCWYQFTSPQTIEGCCKQYIYFLGFNVGHKTKCNNWNLNEILSQV